MRPPLSLLARCAILGLMLGIASAHAHGLGTDEMAEDAKAFLASLSPALRAKTALPLSSPARKNWSFSAQDAPRVTLAELSETQRKLVENLLKEGLSGSGYTRFAAGLRNSPLCSIAIFGKPGSENPWAWRIDGPDLALNFTIADEDNVALTPAFFGGSAAATNRGGRAALTSEEDLGLAFANALTDEQRKTAVLPIPAPGKMIAAGQSRVTPPAPTGLAYAKMPPVQRQQFIALVTSHVRHFRLELADEALLKIIAAGWDPVTFAWAGGLGPSDAHYYRIQGPTFLIEFTATSGIPHNVQSVWRDFDGDFGRDLLNDEKDRAGK